MNPTAFNREDEQLNIFYGERWQHRDRGLDVYEYSGYILGEQIRAGERVLHINCGNNPFKDMIANLHSFDPANPRAEIISTLEYYAAVHRTQQFNVALCLNAFDDGDDNYVQSQIALVMRLMRKRDARIYWRTSTTGTYPWTFDAHTRLSGLFDYRIAGMCYDHNNTIYAEWNSNNTTLNLQG
jgi:hypothetical protein